MRRHLPFVLRALAVAAAIAACSTELDIRNHGVEPADGGSGDGDGDGDGSASADGGEGVDGGIVPSVDPPCSLSVNRSTIDFGQGFPAEVQEETVFLRSFSASPTVVTATASGGVFTVAPTTITVLPGGQMPVNVTYSRATTAMMSTGSAFFTWGTQCTQSIGLKGETVAATDYAVAPGTLDLGSVACGTAPPQGKIVVKVPSAGLLNRPWQAAFPADAGSFFLPIASGTLAMNNNDIFVGGNALAPKTNPREESRVLTLAIDDAGSRPITVVTKSLGAKLVFVKRILRLTATSRNGTVEVRNEGNAPVKIAMALPAPFAIAPPNDPTILPGATGAVVVKYIGNTASSALVQVTLVSGNVCSTNSPTEVEVGSPM